MSTADKILYTVLAAAGLCGVVAVFLTRKPRPDVADAFTDPAYAPYSADGLDREPTGDEAGIWYNRRFKEIVGELKAGAERDESSLRDPHRDDPAHPDHHYSWRLTHHIPCEGPDGCLHPHVSALHCRYDGIPWPCLPGGQINVPRQRGGGDPRMWRNANPWDEEGR